MASITTSGESYTLSIPTTTLSGAVVGLDLLTAAQTSAVINEGTYHVANTVACHIKFSEAGTVATNAGTLLLAGERNLTIPSGMRVSVIKAAGQTDGIIRLTEVD